MKSCLKYTIFFLFFALPLLSFAQLPTSIKLVTMDTIPEIPSPGQSVTVQIESFSTDLNAASVVWLVDGKSFTQGMGVKSITLTAPQLGKTITVVAVIMTAEKREIRESIVLKSGSVDLSWESGGFVPPFFRGKTTFAYENPLRIIATPNLADANGVAIDPRTLIYKWTKNDKVLQDQSGYGKQIITIQEEIPRDITVRVEVGTADGKNKAASSLTLTPGDPTVSFYEEDPLYGVLYNKSLRGNVTLSNQEISIRAVPYSFNTSRTSPLSYVWSINNLERTDLSTKESIILRTKGDVEGSSIISLDVTSPQSILQGADNSVTIFFSKKKSGTNNFTF